ncbi:MAG: class I tRNA ligase family protein, partial [Nannocystaceae bacterium]
MSSRVLVTAALTYANGSPHIGHLLEAIQTDVYVRSRRLTGEDVAFVWAADTHGTPIQLKARDLGIPPEELITRNHADHLEVYKGFDLAFDIYHTTHSDETRLHAERVFRAIDEAGGVQTRDVEQLYCPNDQMFLPDRFVKGTCPRCKAPDQYGDNCEVCSATYSPMELIDPKSAISGATPVEKDSEHFFFKLPE